MSSSRKWLLVLLAVAASFSVVVAAIWVASGRGNGRSTGSGDRVLRGEPPKVTFAPGVSSGNAEVDAFITRFIDLCRRGDYEQYRLCWTAYYTPVSGERFRSMWEFARNVVISEITPVPQTSKAADPAYLIKARVELDPHSKARIASKDVELMVQWEDNRWAIAPAPRIETVPDTLPFMDSDPASEPDAATSQQG